MQKAFLLQIPPLSHTGWLIPVLAVMVVLFCFVLGQVSIALSADSRQPLGSLSPNSLQTLNSLSPSSHLSALFKEEHTRNSIYIFTPHFPFSKGKGSGMIPTPYSPQTTPYPHTPDCSSSLRKDAITNICGVLCSFLTAF